MLQSRNNANKSEFCSNVFCTSSARKHKLWFTFCVSKTAWLDDGMTTACCLAEVDT